MLRSLVGSEMCIRDRYMNIREKKIKDLITNQPALIVLDAKMRIPVTSNIFKTKNRLVIIITDSKNANNHPITTYSENVVIKYVNTFNNGKINLKDIYEIANTYDLNDILIECGNTFSRYLIKENAVDEFMPVSYTHLTLPTNREV